MMIITTITKAYKLQQDNDKMSYKSFWKAVTKNLKEIPNEVSRKSFFAYFFFKKSKFEKSGQKLLIVTAIR